MVPSFVSDWNIGLKRFQSTNPNFSDFDSLGKPVFAGLVFNGFDTARKHRSSAEIKAKIDLGEKKMVRADKTMHGRITSAIKSIL